uniref:Mothers against decapentaplegic homolog n=1 Tax=Meloidogyne hapla TaxID=6305 RepID=A0A1I8BWT7_MELHA
MTFSFFRSHIIRKLIFKVTDDERRAKRRFLTLMRGFDTEDLEILRRAVESVGIDIKQCAPGPPMDLIEERESSTSEDEEELEPEAVPGCSTTVLSTRPRHSMRQMEKDRILFQRQRVSTVAEIQPQGGIGTLITTQQIDNKQLGNYQRRYSTNRYNNNNRKISNYSSGRRCAMLNNPINEENEKEELNIILNSPKTKNSIKNEEQQKQFNSRTAIPPPPDSIATDAETQKLLPPPPETSGGVDSGLIPQIDKPMSMPYLCCKIWRWKDLQVDAALHRLDPLPWCRFGRVTINNATVSCCNPYHYALWIRPETISSDEQSISSGVLANGGGGGVTARLSNETADATIGHVRTAFQHSLKSETKNILTKQQNDSSKPPPITPPEPPQQIEEIQMGNHLPLSSKRRISHSVHHQAMSWGRMARWQFNERVGDVITLIGQFALIGQLAGCVFDGQDVKCPWDLDNFTSFALIRQPSDESSEIFDEVWLYNSSNQPLFMCISKNAVRTSSSEAPNIRRLSPGYCIRVHRVSNNLSSPRSPQHNQTIIANDISPQHFGETTTTQIPSSPVSMLTISIGSGWGANYDQKSVANLECRYEVIFN